MPSRMQITIDPELRSRAARKAERQGISIAEYVRRAIAKDLGAIPEPPPVSAIFDLGRTDSNIARDKDRMIAEAFEAEHRRRK